MRRTQPQSFNSSPYRTRSRSRGAGDHASDPSSVPSSTATTTRRLTNGHVTASGWGRHSFSSSARERYLTIVTTVAILTLCPLLVVYYWSSCAFFQCRLLGPLTAILKYGFIPSLKKYGPPFEGVAAVALIAWYLFQALLYLLLPGPRAIGQLTPAGYLPTYTVNGLRAWVVSHVAVALYLWLGVPAGRRVDALAFLSDHWGGLLVASNVLAYALSLLVYLKAHYWPSEPEKDRKWSESALYDFYMGVELNPRIGRNFDLKLFHNGRPGIIAWTLINVSFAAYQYRRFGSVSNSIMLVTILQGIYSLDLFLHESWYLRTLDIAHDHFGFYLAWGDLVWLPFMYTVQGYYLSRNYVHLQTGAFWFLLALGLTGYAIFRVTNNQKDGFRMALKEGSSYHVIPKWLTPLAKYRQPALYVSTKYRTSDGKEHTSALLTSGFWGVARHFNYTGDLILATAMCLACGNAHFYPYFYLLFMLVLLINRIYRDEARCKAKYGSYWDTYCTKVPYRLVPYIF